MKRIKPYIFAVFVTILFLTMIFCLGKASYLMAGLAFNPNESHTVLAGMFSLLFGIHTVFFTFITYEIIKDQWETL